MNVLYQRNLSSSIYPNYNKSIQYNPLFSSPQKNPDYNNSFTYGMRHYYSAEIKSYKKTSHDPKPVYILNPQFIANQIFPINNNINQNILYSIPYQVHTADIGQRAKLNNINAIPSNMNVNSNQLNNNLINNNNINSNDIIYYSQATYNKIISNQNPNAINGQVIYNGINQQNNYNINQNINNIYYNTNQNNLVNMIHEEEKINNNLKLENIEIQNFNHTMPNLKGNNEIYTQWKNEFNHNIINERKTYQEIHKIPELDNYTYNEPMRQTENNILFQNKINNISFPKNDNIFQNQIILQKQNTINRDLKQ